jgi:hypothetical protein
MKYVKHLPDLNWQLVTPDSEEDNYLREHGIFKLIEHKEPHESWDLTRWKIIEHCELQTSLRMVHRFYRMVPIDAYETDRSVVIDSTMDSTNT